MEVDDAPVTAESVMTIPVRSIFTAPVRSVSTTSVSTAPVRSVSTANASTNTVHNAFNATTHIYPSCSDAVTQTIVLKCDIETQSCLTVYHKSVQTEPKVSDASTSTDDLELEPVPFSIEQIKDNDSDVTFYTGFTSFLHFLACFNILGLAE